jgi:tetratricopeptide (TPR) repeat protein
LDNLLEIGDRTFSVLKYAGICKSLQKNYDEAIVLLRKAYQQVSTDKEVMLHLANSLSYRSDCFDEAVELISKIRKSTEPDSAIIYQTNTLLAQSYLSIKDTVNAIQQYYYSINSENLEDRLLRMTSLANNVRAETTETLLWYVHYYFLQNYKSEYQRNWNFLRQQSFSINLMEEFIRYMHWTGQKKVSWQTFDKKTKTITMDDLRKIMK